MKSVIHAQNSLSTPNTSRAPSPQIWSDFPKVDFLERPLEFGFYMREDWSKMPVLATPTITSQAFYGNGWKAFGSSGGTVVAATIEGGGGLVLTETDDNQGIGMQFIQLPFKISRSKGKFWYEVRLKTNTITDTRHGIFVGLAGSATLSATVPIAAAGTLADINLVGFHRLEADGDQLDTVYKADGVTQVTLQSDAIPSATSLAADTYIKLGMKFDPYDNKLRFYVNGIECSTTYTMASADGTDFPNDVQLAPILALLCASDDDAIVTWDWIEAAQRFVA